MKKKLILKKKKKRKAKNSCCSCGYSLSPKWIMYKFYFKNDFKSSRNFFISLSSPPLKNEFFKKINTRLPFKMKLK